MLKREMQIEQAFKSQREYFEIMRDWHAEHDGLAIEPKIREIIEANLISKVLDAGCGEGSILGLLRETQIQDFMEWIYPL